MNSKVQIAREGSGTLFNYLISQSQFHNNGDGPRLDASSCERGKD